MKILTGMGMKLYEGQQLHKFIPPSGSLEVYMKTFKAIEYFDRMNKEDNLLARQKVEEAIALDPEYGVLYSMLAGTHLLDLIFQSSESPEISFAQANKNIKKALALDEEDSYAHLVLSHLYLITKEHDKAFAAAERAITFNPNGADAYRQLGLVLIMSGRAEEGIKHIEKAIRLNPLPPSIYLNDLACAFRFLGRYEDAIEVYKEALRLSPTSLISNILLTEAYVASGREVEARQQAQEVLRLDPSFSLDEYARMLFLKDEAVAKRHIGNLRKAGLK
jgi:tetratricopeptide (TPR) repeat protein